MLRINNVRVACLDVAPRGIEWIEVGGDAAAITAWLGGAVPSEVRFCGGAPGVAAVGIATERCAIELRLPEAIAGVP